jgi:hypothetical protein
MENSKVVEEEVLRVLLYQLLVVLEVVEEQVLLQD